VLALLSLGFCPKSFLILLIWELYDLVLDFILFIFKFLSLSEMRGYWITMKKRESYRWPHPRNQKHHSWCQWFHFTIGMSLECFCPLTRGKGKLTFENTFWLKINFVFFDQLNIVLNLETDSFMFITVFLKCF